MAEDTRTASDDPIFSALGALSRVLGKVNEYEDFMSYINWASKSQVPSQQEIIRHTPEWVQLVLPILGKLYDKGYRNGVRDENEAFRVIFKK